jgi:predicted transcriptional regulator
MVETKEKFSIERFESVMDITNTSWNQINGELKFNVERMLKDRQRPPMKNVIRKACDLMGLKNSDYVMMISEDFEVIQILDDSEKKVSRGRPAKLSEEQIKRAIEMIDSGLTYESVAKHFNVGYSTLCKYVSKAKGKSKGEKIMRIPEEVKTVVEQSQQQRQNKNFINDIFYKIDRISDEELNKVQEYLDATRKLRALRNSLLE